MKSVIVDLHQAVNQSEDDAVGFAPWLVLAGYVWLGIGWGVAFRVWVAMHRVLVPAVCDLCGGLG